MLRNGVIPYTIMNRIEKTLIFVSTFNIKGTETTRKSQASMDQGFRLRREDTLGQYSDKRRFRHMERQTFGRS